VQVVLIKDRDTQTSVRIAVTEQKRKRGFTANRDEYYDPTVNEEASAKVAEELAPAIKGS